jgi:hypothetical protein
VLKEIAKTRGDDLPGYSELVFEPAAFHGLSAFGKFFPEFIDFFLSRAIDYEGDRGRELVDRAPIQRNEL